MKKVFAVAALLVLMCSSLAFATDDFIYPGVMGVRQNASHPVPEERWGALCNPSPNQWLYMALPIPRDQVNKSIAYAYVKVIDRHHDEKIYARLIAPYRDDEDKIYAYQSKELFTSGDGPNIQTLSFHGGVGTSKITPAYFFVRLPPSYKGGKSEVLSYYVNENN